VKHIFQPKITLAYQDTNYTTPVILMVQRTEEPAMLTKGTIEKYELLKHEEDSIQATSIKVQGLLYEINVTVIYCPHQHNQKREHFEAFFQTQGPEFIAPSTL